MQKSHHSMEAGDRNKRAVEELIRGRQLTTQLQAIIKQAPDDDDDDDDDDGSATATTATSAEDLVTKILESLNGSISMLINSVSGELGGRKSQDYSSTESCKTTSSSSSGGCYKKKRRRTSDEIWKTETSALTDDGHSWRKYGQKRILSAKHPRNYFRCTHKYDQRCQATKQVQKIEDDPPRFLTTYFGRHTCKTTLEAPPQIIIDSADQDSSFLLSFDSNKPSCPCPSSSVKQEILQDFESFCPANLSHDYYMPTELMTDGFETSSEAVAATLSSDTMVVPVDFDDVLQFEF